MIYLVIPAEVAKAHRLKNRAAHEAAEAVGAFPTRVGVSGRRST